MNEIDENVNSGTNEQKWYVIHTYAGYENRVMANLQKRVESMGMQDKIFQILVPMEKEIITKGGQRKLVKKKIFPGYVLVEMIIEDDSWYVVRNTPGVTGFVGSGSKPIPLTEDEINGILKQMGLAEGKPRIDLEINQLVRVIDGPFKNFEGTVEEINVEKGKLKVLVSMFGREVPVELDFHQVERL
ncbi:MAG TPA: transcription termination/antitermination protein NusG [Firmicutes bacterium]|nr:transcription termination/antitermination protein NusG [Bacillota bacterium]